SLAQKQRRYRLKVKLNPEKEAASKKKHLERYHLRKKLVKDMREQEHRAAKRKWKIANKKRRARDRRRVRRNRSALYGRNL
ncbi:hypothetical protein HHI36_006895, partial [Cryptolaemus montrouzieri]